MTGTYKHAVRLVGYDEHRRQELVNYLGQLIPGKGKLFFDEIFAKVDAEDFPIIYQTNSLPDAHRTCFTIHSHGGHPEPIEL